MAAPLLSKKAPQKTPLPVEGQRGSSISLSVAISVYSLESSETFGNRSNRLKASYSLSGSGGEVILQGWAFRSLSPFFFGHSDSGPI
jgi:hypothetical protein